MLKPVKGVEQFIHSTKVVLFSVSTNLDCTVHLLVVPRLNWTLSPHLLSLPSYVLCLPADRTTPNVRRGRGGGGEECIVRDKEVKVCEERVKRRESWWMKKIVWRILLCISSFWVQELGNPFCWAAASPYHWNIQIYTWKHFNNWTFHEKHLLNELGDTSLIRTHLQDSSNDILYGMKYWWRS